jgi:hypothetical protein
MAGLVEVPLSLTSSKRFVCQIRKGGPGQIDGVNSTVSTLVDNLGCGGLAIVLDGNCLSTVWVGGCSARQSAHHIFGKSNHLVCSSVVGNTTCAQTGIIIGEISSARASRTARAAGNARTCACCGGRWCGCGSRCGSCICWSCSGRWDVNGSSRCGALDLGHRHWLDRLNGSHVGGGGARCNVNRGRRCLLGGGLEELGRNRRR